MAADQAGRRGIDTRTEVLDEPTGTIEFERPEDNPAGTRPDALGEDYRPSSSSYLAGHEGSAVQKAEQRRTAPDRSGRGRGLWRALRNWLVGH